MNDPRDEGATDIAGAVQAFYERHPYPAVVDTLDRYGANADDPERRLAEHHLLRPFASMREDPAVLVAGCGTVQAIKYAMRWPRARITGIDVSAASLARARELKDRYRLDGLELRQLPVERARELDARFDHILCTGVLHHLADPDAGLAALRDVLAAGGTLHLMLYAPYGRAGIYLLQEYCQRLEIGATAAEIHDLVGTLQALPKGHPVWPLLRESADFRYDAGIADALLHPRDRPYSVPQFLEFVARGGLRFVRWLRQAPYLPQCGAPAASPHAARLAALDPAAQYAEMELFRGSMTRHSAIVQRDDGHPPRTIGFAGDRWLAYKPIRMPGAVCIEERLPRGAAGVLINRRHTDTDIYLPIDALEKHILGQVDGRRALRELDSRDAPNERLRAFFEKLWWYDQVVFDATACADQERDAA